MGLHQSPKKNFLHHVSNGALLAILLSLVGATGIICYQWGKYTSNRQNIELQQSAIEKDKKIQALTDTIITLKLPEKNLIPSLQEPVDTHP